jgi:hypothetical protein
MIMMLFVVVNLFGDDKSNKQPFHKLVVATCLNAILKKRILLIATIVLFLLVFLVIILYFSQIS